MTDVKLHILALVTTAFGFVLGVLGTLLAQSLNRPRHQPSPIHVVTPRAYHLDAPTQILPQVRDPDVTTAIYPSTCLWPDHDRTAQYPHINGGNR